MITGADLSFTRTAEFSMHQVDGSSLYRCTGCGIMSTSHQALAQQVCQQR